MHKYFQAMFVLLALRFSRGPHGTPPARQWGRNHNCQAYAVDAPALAQRLGIIHPGCNAPRPGTLALAWGAQADVVTRLMNAKAHLTPEGADLLWQADGLIPHAPGAPALSPTGWEVAGFVAVGEDHHLVRQDGDRRLSHKRGTRRPTRSHLGLPLWIPLWLWRGRNKAPYVYVGTYWCEPAWLASRPSPRLVARVHALAAQL